MLMLAACFTAMLVPTLLGDLPIYDSLFPAPVSCGLHARLLI
jgi:hypothetical protein